MDLYVLFLYERRKGLNDDLHVQPERKCMSVFNI